MHMLGGPPQQDLFDYKPGLKDWYDKDLPDSIRQGQRLTTMSSGQARFPIAPSVYKFSQHGQSGAWVSELLPHTAKMVDDIAIVKSLYTEQINHEPAITYIQTGSMIGGQALHRIVAGVWPGQHVRRSADVRRHECRAQQPADADSGDVGADVELGISSREDIRACRLRAGAEPVLFINNPDGVSHGCPAADARRRQPSSTSCSIRRSAIRKR